MPESVKATVGQASESRNRRIVHACAWVAAAVFLLMLALRDLQWDRALDVGVVRFDRATPYVSTFGPPSRVDASSRAALLTGEPVYVNLRMPRWFRRATVDIRFENPHALPFRLGVRTHPTAWTFQFPDAMDCPTLRVGQSCRRVAFDLQRAWQVERNVYRFVLSAPRASHERPLIIHSFRVTAERDPICIGSRLCV